MRFKIQVPKPSILMQTSFDPISLSSFFLAESLGRQKDEIEVAALAWRREKGDREPGPKGYGPFIDPRIPDTSGICGLAVFVPKIYSLDSKPLLCYSLVQKGIQS